MAIIARTYQKAAIDLNGPDGNAFFLLGTAKRLAKELNLDEKAITEEMRSGDYENLVTVFDKHFGDIVDLIRDWVKAVIYV